MSVNIIIPFYNSATFIDTTLNSLVAQTHKDIELICVNDGSSDNTLEILQEWKNKDPRIIVINKENGGIETSLKAAVPYFTKKYTFLIGHDDTLSSDAIEIAVKEMESSPEIDSVRMKLVVVDEKKQVSEIKDDTRILEGIQALRETIIDWKIHNFCLWKTEIFRQINDVTVGGLMNFDEVATRYLYTKCRKVSFCRGEYYYLQHSESVTHKLSPRLLDAYAVDYYIKKLLVDANIYSDFKDQFEPYMFRRLKNITNLHFELKAKGFPLTKKDLGKVKLLHAAIDFDYLNEKKSLLHKLKYHFLYKPFNIYYFYTHIKKR
ncbi:MULTISPECIES: glycosyltransferase family 2 protein [Chryseobacterium]|uniref:glycosyltransferase family 2 protein n=1 Tax=Chryseobacterium TaxID=59732 RepID=UPI0016272F7C|nr:MULTISPECIES: glycosyltransferase family 2 protein [Chryseobacterium]MDM1553638.1 glycosyltransferase family 2 protein [Chryseobacterium indologenes]